LFSLSQNYPNPFNPTTHFGFQIANFGFVSIKIYDINGREIETIVNGHLNQGTYEVEWNASNYPSGVYYYTMTAGEFKDTKKMIVLK
jgi:flagellar hook assembly protein FlgD